MANLKNITDLPVAESAEGLNLIANDNGTAKQIDASAVGIQANWNQNNPTAPDYVKNRPFYTGDLVEMVLVEEQTAVFNDNPLLFNGSFQAGDTLIVIWDGASYETVAFLIDMGDVSGAFAGNTVFNDGDDNGIPFAIASSDGKVVVLAVTQGNHTFKIVALQPEIFRVDKKYLPSTIPYMQNGLIPLNYVLPDDYDVFGGPLAAGGTYSTLANPYPNKKILNSLTLESFNAMLDGSMFLPKRIMVDNNIASVSLSDSQINVSWNDHSIYYKSGIGFAGAHSTVYDASIHEDADNPGTIISEYAMILVADAPLT